MWDNWTVLSVSQFDPVQSTSNYRCIEW